MNILIVKRAALGDVLRTTALLRPLREKYPGAAISWICSEAAGPLLEGNPYLEAIGLSAPKQSWRAHFDLVLSLEEDASAARWARECCRGDLVGVRLAGDRLEYTARSSPYYGMSLLNGDADGGLESANALKRANRRTYAEIWLEILGIPPPRDRSELRPILNLSSQDRAEAEKLLSRRGLSPGRVLGVNLSAGARWPSKQPSLDRVVELIKVLRKGLDIPLLLLGGAEEESRNREIIRRLPFPIADAGCGHGLRAFAGIVESCAAVLTADTLAFHLAAALSRPAVVLVGPTSACELDAHGETRKITALDCSCFYQARCRLEKSCLDLIPAEGVLRAIHSVLGEPGGRSHP